MLLTALSLLLAVGALIPLGYLALLTLVSAARRAPPRQGDKTLVAVIPAHNEELGIESTVKSLLAADYPSDKRRVVVVADNCIDATAARARAAGADVLERTDAVKRGKGYALELGFAHALADRAVDAVVVIDADTVVAENLWRSLSDHLAGGFFAVQAANRVRNRDATWRTRLLAIALAMINGVRCLGRERLSLSAGLKGNGMAFSRAALDRAPYRAYGLVEDVEYAVDLALAGIRVRFAADTWIASESPETGAAAVSQRKRWEGGRIELLRTMLPRVLRSAFSASGHRAVLLDIAAELLIPPLSYPALLLAVGALIEGSLFVTTGDVSPAAWLWLSAAAALVAHVLRGWQLSGTGWSGLFALCGAPIYIAWKLLVAKPFGRAQSWVRTRRVAENESNR
jgi:cellulose synthase/poly-beta-1,6-N-acetylglucosamine synthase-like glycosyltransferase